MSDVKAYRFEVWAALYVLGWVEAQPNVPERVRAVVDRVMESARMATRVAGKTLACLRCSGAGYECFPERSPSKDCPRCKRTGFEPGFEPHNVEGAKA